ncbi:MAG TPA: hypothetical protein PK306_05840, partial [Aquabacterium sp.]|nr:hypothetical protein [Aquabacterium sp.]
PLHLPRPQPAVTTMAVLPLGRPLESKAATLLVENKLAAGQHRFALVVIDGDGNESAPDVLTVTVRSPTAPPIRLRTPVAPTPATRPGRIP